MGIETAIIGAGVLGLGGSILGANAAERGAEEAAGATRDATAAQVAEQRRQYDQTRQDFAPFRELAPESLATLQSAVYGRPVEYTDINGNKVTATGQQFDLANFRPESTAAFDWQKARTLEDLGNYFNLIGRGRGSTVQSNATARSLGDLNAREYESGYNRLFQRKQDYTNDLLNLVKTAQGAAGTTSTSGSQAAGNISQAYQNQGNTLANIAQQQGQTQANLYSGIVPSLINTASTGMMLNKYMGSTGTPATAANNLW